MLWHLLSAFYSYLSAVHTQHTEFAKSSAVPHPWPCLAVSFNRKLIIRVTSVSQLNPLLFNLFFWGILLSVLWISGLYGLGIPSFSSSFQQVLPAGAWLSLVLLSVPPELHPGLRHRQQQWQGRHLAFLSSFEDGAGQQYLALKPTSSASRKFAEVWSVIRFELFFNWPGKRHFPD